MRLTVACSWKYFTAPQASLAHRRISLPFGKILGGSSSTNAMMFFRGSPECYDRWEQLGCPGWNFSSLLPFFCRSERWQDGPSPLHGARGPVAVSRPRHLAPFSHAFLEACLQSGIPYTGDFNASPSGAGFFPVMQHRGRRAAPALAYLQPARSRLTVQTGALIHRILLHRSRATGVQYRHPSGELLLAHAHRAVILCAGALNSPQLLLLSGIGPAPHLRRLGIPVHTHLPGVGANLQDHVRIPVLFESPQPSPGDMRYWIPAALQYALARRGVLASNCCEAGALLSSHPSIHPHNLQFVTHFQSHLYPNTVDLQFCIVRTASRGAVSLASSDPTAPPIIDPRYLSHPADIAAALAGIRLARRLAAAPALRRFPLTREVLPGNDLLHDSDLEAYARAYAETCYHPAGSCRMGSDPLAVVDPSLRVRGFENLYVADASIIPELPNGNTCAIVLMIAERAASLITEPLPPSISPPAPAPPPPDSAASPPAAD
jgi:choline dehydrogenase